MKNLFQRGVNIYSDFLTKTASSDSKAESHIEHELFVDDILKHANLPVSDQFGGFMLPRERYLALGVDCLEGKLSLSETLLAHSTERTEWAMTDDRSRTHTIIVTPGPEPDFDWDDSHPCTPDGAPCERSAGNAVHLKFKGRRRFDNWLEKIRYDSKRVVLFSLWRVKVADSSAEIAQNIPNACGECNLCFLLPAQIGLSVCCSQISCSFCCDRRARDRKPTRRN
jgi:hypothetical protein